MVQKFVIESRSFSHLGLKILAARQNQCCGSGILIFTDPGSQIPDPKTATKERGERNWSLYLFFIVTNFTKL
jgi:hypothetical protein